MASSPSFLYGRASSSGGPPGKRNGQYRHGERTKAAIAEQRKFGALLKMRVSPTIKPGLKLAAIGLREGGDGEVASLISVVGRPLPRSLPLARH